MDSDISLNVFASDPALVKKKGHKKFDKNSVTIDLSWKNRKPEDNQHKNEEASGNNNSQSDDRRPYRSADSNKRKFHGDRGGKDKRVVSSLWCGNPEVSPLPKPKKLKSDNDSQPLFSELTFVNAGLHPFMASNLEKLLESNQMTEVQRRTIPVLLSGKDALVRSHTGSGKTLAYAVPIIQALQAERPKISRSDGTLALIIVPTRELALQTYEWLVKLVKSFTWLVPGVLSGGEKKKSEKARMRKGVTILVATPGRLLDHITNTEVCNLKRVRFLVLDEADRMMDLGYEKDVASIVSALNEQGEGGDGRQTVLLSATLGPGVERLAGLALKEPRAFVDASAADETQAGPASDEIHSVPDSLEQWALVIPAKLRLVALSAFIAAKCELNQEGKMLVFCATQDMVDFLNPLLSSCLAPDTDEEDEDAESNEEDSSEDEDNDDHNEKRTKIKANVNFFRLHGNMTQKERMEVFKTFRDSKSGVLFCTDVASRGLDLPQVDWIIQFTAPATVQDYVHRVGRTARVGAKGSAVLFLVPSETEYVKKLQEQGIVLKEMDAEKCLDDLLALVPQPDLRRRGRRKVWRPSVEGVATALQLRFESAVLGDKTLHGLACKAYTSFVRFYASYPREAKEYFHYRALHLGHYAKSFALRDAPSAIGGIGSRNWQRGQQQEEYHSSRSPGGRRGGWNSARGGSRGARGNSRGGRTGPTADKTRELMMSEYASGM